MRSDRIKFRHLRCMIAVAENVSSVRAARVLSLSQPAVSKTLSELEEIVGVALFARSLGGFELTEAGNTFLRYARECVRSVTEGIEAANDIANLSVPSVRVGTLPAAAGKLSEWLSAYKATYPNVALQVITGANRQLLTALRKGELDFVFGRLSDGAEIDGLKFDHLYSEPLVFAVRPEHPLLGKTALLLLDMYRYEIVLPDRGTSARFVADQFLLSAGIGMPKNVMESIDVSFCHRHVLGSDAIWFATLGVVASEFHMTPLSLLDFDTSITRGSIGLTRRSVDITNQAAHHLFEHIASEAAKFADQYASVSAQERPQLTPGARAPID